MDFLIELLMEVLGEAVLTIFAEAFESTLPGGNKKHPARAFAAFLLFGGVGGVLSVVLWPHALLHSEGLRFVAFVGSPMLCAFVLYFIARFRGASADVARLAAWHGFTLSLTYQFVRVLGLALTS